MKVIHITPTRKVKSIIKHGIKRSKPTLFQYEDVMIKDYGDTYDPERGLVCTINLDFHIERYFKHFAYWRIWGKPRNKVITDHWSTVESFNKLMEIGPKAFSHVVPMEDSFIALLVKIPFNPLQDRYIHEQSHRMNPQWHDMEERYEHNDMPLNLINYDINPKCIQGSIGTATTNIRKDGKIDVFTSMKMRRLT